MKNEKKDKTNKVVSARKATGVSKSPEPHIHNPAVCFATPIVSEGHPALRQISHEIPLPEITTTKIQNVIEDMKCSLASQDDGIGLAAPQIGIPLRIFIVSKKIFSTRKADGADIDPANISRDTTEAGTDQKGIVLEDLVFINPILVKESKEKKWMDGEGCLSVRWVYGKVKRSTKVTIRAYDQYGRAFERGAGGLLAHIFQHEVDHLNGILFIDKARDLERVDPDKQKEQDNAKPIKKAAKKTKGATI
jgi:peptide deformylase